MRLWLMGKLRHKKVFQFPFVWTFSGNTFIAWIEDWFTLCCTLRVSVESHDVKLSRSRKFMGLLGNVSQANLSLLINMVKGHYKTLMLWATSSLPSNCLSLPSLQDNSYVKKAASTNLLPNTHDNLPWENLSTNTASITTWLFKVPGHRGRENSWCSGLQDTREFFGVCVIAWTLAFGAESPWEVSWRPLPVIPFSTAVQGIWYLSCSPGPHGHLGLWFMELLLSS